MKIETINKISNAAGVIKSRDYQSAKNAEAMRYIGNPKQTKPNKGD